MHNERELVMPRFNLHAPQRRQRALGLGEPAPPERI
jgi:hypothetical protein